MLTHTEGSDYFDYIRAIKKNPIAKIVKLADIAHNLDETRLSECKNITEKQRSLWHQKYITAKSILEQE